ncbi:Zinc finger SWIM-type [Arabidopsis suecica]|uniref:Zinc finger SWIM-type n=1 Tax=Arabidopsis suecica TaxID=45249 RepID=A0A8T1Z7J7_ARASU|nr:Zinc finger SWIM-type [Arabidopsis suecica]
MPLVRLNGIISTIGSPMEDDELESSVPVVAPPAEVISESGGGDGGVEAAAVDNRRVSGRRRTGSRVRVVEDDEPEIDPELEIDPEPDLEDDCAVYGDDDCDVVDDAVAGEGNEDNVVEEDANLNIADDFPEAYRADEEAGSDSDTGDDIWDDEKIPDPLSSDDEDEVVRVGEEAVCGDEDDPEVLLAIEKTFNSPDDFKRAVLMYSLKTRYNIKLYRSESLMVAAKCCYGLVKAIHNVLPQAEHRQCSKHIMDNWKRDNHDMELQRLFWKIARSYTIEEFNTHMANLKSYNPQAYASLQLTSPMTWSRAFFRIGCERHLARNNLHEIYVNDVGYFVDMDKKTCGCRKWEMVGIPCVHAACVIIGRKEKVEDYVSDYYTKVRWRETYRDGIRPVQGMSLWPRMSRLPVLPPPWRRGNPGRQSNYARKKGRYETASSSNKNKMSRANRIMTCSNCKQEGHNKSSCKNATVLLPPPRPRGRPSLNQEPQGAQSYQEQAVSGHGSQEQAASGHGSQGHGSQRHGSQEQAASGHGSQGHGSQGSRAHGPQRQRASQRQRSRAHVRSEAQAQSQPQAQAQEQRLAGLESWFNCSSQL